MGFETNFINETVTKTSFVDTPAQSIFAKWCEINDSIAPQFIEREKWEQRDTQGILEKNDQGKQTLFLPTDLRLWEMMDVIRTVDHDTLTRKPENKDERADKVQELGIIFEKAGLYLSEYLPTLEEKNGKQVAQNIAQEFYQYGLSLQHKEKVEGLIPEGQSLSNQDKTVLDEWFLGEEAYQTRLARLGDNPTEGQREEIRKKLLSVYFKALAGEGYKADSEKPWETKVGPIQHLQDKTGKQIIKAIETPEREMKTTIFRRGVEKLVTEMKEVGWRKATNDFLKKVGFDPPLEQRRLYDTLHIDDLKQELTTVRSTGNVVEISAKELEIAQKIQKAVRSFPYSDGDEGPDHPSRMVETQYINCVGSSILGGGLLQEVGIKYLHADLPKHSSTVLVTSDKKAYWQDFTPGLKNLTGNYTEITSDMFENGAFTSNLDNSGLSLIFKEFNPYLHVHGQLRVNLVKPEMGLQCHILFNTGDALRSLDRNEEAIEAYKQAINIDPKIPDPYSRLGDALRSLDRNEEAIEAYKQAINIDPKIPDPYSGLGNVLSDLDRKEEAIVAYNQAISVDSKNDSAYFNLGLRYTELGRKREAVESFKQHNKIVGNSEDEWVKKANQIIIKLEKT